ncbi:protein SCAR4 isoform X2 [Asparagus officinalis]|uniref:protein SCAR4 isoform X2 n=1 Tax=Asparagus officinalis TaxID=4686 RepID=UPI00098E4B59|nr:protein SCAR4 isoform X2 [Asparagus officinalis]
MPIVRYEIRNELGLGSSKLYGAAATREDSEALLEGVAVAGLVGILKQLGDLAEFSSGIFHKLHEEVMATASRANVLALRVQQVEAEIPSVEKSLLCQNSETHYFHNMGTNWHSKLQLNHNVISGEGLPQFMMDSYEECRGTPDLSVLDKYDVSGAGACLKRYSDPSFFKVGLASSGIVESQVEKEKVMHESKKKKFWRNGDAPAIFSTPKINSKLQFMTSDQASEEFPGTHVKLKSRDLNGSDPTTSYTECLHQVLLPKENCQSNNSNCCSHIKMESIGSSESISDVNGVPFDPSAEIGKCPNQYPIFEDTCQMVKKRVPEHEESTEGSEDELNASSGFQEMDQKELSSDNDWRTGGSSGGYNSDDIASGVENYKDARNTMESDVESDYENNAKAINFRTYDEHELKAPDSRLDFDEIFNSVESDSEKLIKNRVALDLPSNQDIYLDETDDKTPAGLSNLEAKLDSSGNLLSSGEHSAKETLISAISGHREEFLNCSVMGSTSSAKHSSSNGDPDSTSSATSNMDEISSSPYGRKDGGRLEVEISTSLIEGSSPPSNVLMGTSQDCAKQVVEVSQDEITTQLGHSSSSSRSPNSKQRHNSVKEFRNLGTSQDDIGSRRVEMTLESTNLQPLCDEESQEPYNTGSLNSCPWKEEILDNTQQSSKVSDFSKDAVHAEAVASFEQSAVQNSIESDCYNQISCSGIDQDHLDPFDANLSNGHTPPSGFAQMDLHPNNIEEDCINLSVTDKGFDPETSSCYHQESAKEKETLRLQSGSVPKIISFERYLSMKNNGNETNLLDTAGEVSDSVTEPESYDTVNNVTFAEFLKLAQMDWLLNIEKEGSVDPLQSGKRFDRQAPLQMTRNAKEDLFLSSHLVTKKANSFEETSDMQIESESNMTSLQHPSGSESIIDSSVQETMEELPPMPPLPPLEWRMSKLQMGHPTSHIKIAQSYIGQNQFTALTTDEKPSYDSLTARGATVQKSSLLSPFLSLEDNSEHCLSVQVPPLENETFHLDQLPSKLKRPQHCPPSLEMETEKPTSTFFLGSTSESESHQCEDKFPGAIEEDYALNQDSLTIQMLNGEKPKKISLLQRTRDPLIEDVASHDKSTLRKVTDLLQPSTQSKTEESITLLEQIRNKSQNLKAAGNAKPNLRGPPTNPKIAAILEKANTIRKACVGSDDEDEDGHDWSDS